MKSPAGHNSPETRLHNLSKPLGLLGISSWLHLGYYGPK